VSTRSFGLVLLGLVLSYALSVAGTARQQASLVLLVQMGTVVIALRAAQAHRIARGLVTGAVLLAIVAAVLNLFGQGHATTGLVFVAGAALYLVTPVSIVRFIVRSGRVDREVVLGVIDAYLMIGMCFAFAYRAMGVLTAGPFFGANGEGTTAQTLFFSFTTLTTTGYGNLIPAARLGQSFAVLEMVVGQLFLVTALAKIVSAWRPTRWGTGVEASPGTQAAVADPGTASAARGAAAPPAGLEQPEGEPPPTGPP